MNHLTLRKLIPFAAALVAALASAAATADQIRSVYFYPAARYTFSDPARLANNALGYQFTLGYTFDQHWGVELFSDSDQYKLLDNKATLYTRGLGVQGVYKLFPENDISPIFLLGGGWLRTDLGARQEDAPAARGGLGFHYQPEGAAFGLRADAVLRHEFINAISPERNNYDDVTYSLGFTYRFGLDGSDIGKNAYVSPAPIYTPQSIPTPQVASTQTTEASGKLSRTSFKGRVSSGVSTSTDSDGDGVGNAKDKCSDTPVNAVVDVDGCIIYIKKV